MSARLPCLSVLLVACGGSGEPAPAPSAPAAGPAPAAAPTPAPEAPAERVLSEAEFELLKPTLEDLRAGVRPFSDQSLGVCKTDGRSCVEYVGMDAGELPPGDYLFWAEMRAPKLSRDADWEVTFATDCETERASGSSSSRNEKTYAISTPAKSTATGFGSAPSAPARWGGRPAPGR